MEIRPASSLDAELLAALRYRFRSEMDRPTESQGDFDERMTAWLGDHLEQGWRAWLAFERTHPIGQVFLQIVDKLPNPLPEPEKLGYITSLYVDPNFRASGVGGALLDRAVTYCRKHDFDTVILWPSTQSRSLYEGRGFQAPGEVMELRLVDHPGRSGTGAG